MTEQPLASRGGLKLEAAFEAFRLDVRGLGCVDVGASAGGFTDVLLRRGAAHVTAIEGGHGQMRPALAADRRVTLHERSNFKTLPLRIAAGPFDAFTVDVSFVAARTMLRPLALRLKAGAFGVVLVKPQFELPKELVPRGGISDSRDLRRFALRRFRQKAEALGFEERQAIDCPVAGGDGNVEWLVHLCFLGLPSV